jgi:prepilin-type N-terminal cleavage/methylation domain-containing protein
MRNRGFTLIELVVVMAILAILMVVSTANYRPEEIESSAFYHEVYSSIRYAQKLAITSGAHVRVTLTPNQYTLEHCDPVTHWQAGVDDCTMAANFVNVSNPGQAGNIGGTFASNVMTVGAGIVFTFNPNGLLPFSPGNTVTTIPFSLTGGSSPSIQIIHETGFTSAL